MRTGFQGCLVEVESGLAGWLQGEWIIDCPCVRTWLWAGVGVPEAASRTMGYRVSKFQAGVCH